MEHLNHAADHLTDLIEEERLTFEVEANEFYCLSIICVRHCICLTIHIHEFVRLHFHHVALCCHLMSSDILSEIVVLFGAFETLPELLHLLALLLV